MGEAYAAATLVVARAGALTVAELLQLEKAAVLVPATHVTEDHQQKNAEAISEAGAATFILDEVAEQQLLPTVNELLQNEERRTALRAAMQSLVPKQDACASVAEQLLALAKQNPEYHAV